MAVLAFRILAPAVVEAVADLVSLGQRPGLLRKGGWDVRWPCGWIGEPAEVRPVRIVGAMGGCVVVLEAERAPGDGACSPGESLVIEAGVCNGPIKVLSGQHLSPKLPVVGHPPFPFIVAFGAYYGGLIGPQFGGLLRETGDQYCRHQRKAF